MKTLSENLFEDFCSKNRIEFEKIPEGSTPTCDYRINPYGSPMHVEIKDVEEDQGLTIHEDRGWTYYGKPGELVRRRILAAQKQIKAAAKGGYPAILLIYNGVTFPANAAPTANHDFTHGMYGEMGVSIDLNTNSISGPFHGRENRTLQDTLNTSFSAIGRLEKTREGAAIQIFENMYAKHKIDFSKIPSCIAWNKTGISQ